jgi:hypothetical protein
LSFWPHFKLDYGPFALVYRLVVWIVVAEENLPNGLLKLGGRKINDGAVKQFSPAMVGYHV